MAYVKESKIEILSWKSCIYSLKGLKIVIFNTNSKINFLSMVPRLVP
jgi:hypothetical protein